MQGRKNETELEYTAEGLRLLIMRGRPEAPRKSKDSAMRDYFHAHAWYELFFADRCETTVHFENERYTLHAGSFLLVPPETVHYAELVSEGVHLRVCSFTLERLHPSMPPGLPDGFMDAPRFFGGDELCIMLMRALDAAVYSGNGTNAGSYLFSLLHRAASLYRAEHPMGATVSDSAMGRIFKIEQLLYGFYAEELPLSYIAEQLHLSERQLSRVIKKQYGMGYREKNRELRMRSAARRLLRGESIEEIAKEVGYRSESAFFAAFKSYYGQSPAAYRAEKNKCQKGETHEE